MPIDTALAAPFFGVLLFLAGCASHPNTDVLIDPLKQRLLAREDIALQNLLFARMPGYGYAGGGSYLDDPYDGPAVEPPLPDLNLLPEDMPPWEEFADQPEAEPQPTPIEPVPMEAEMPSSDPAES